MATDMIVQLTERRPSVVMAGLVPAIHASGRQTGRPISAFERRRENVVRPLRTERRGVDGRDKPGHDAVWGQTDHFANVGKMVDAASGAAPDRLED
ncbi:hypothetical protein [Methylosinus sp. KRF6]|uniref:hypothetical protein n=1 Tax=Methylosinus sp. KRF6 TaxID=2846853 RepID=UPI001C0D857F|nr:hypothetical protein [Methylosinus sp. KRF6]MBU3888567.1 hypothetical protein [Methylosinus sp. KRF6]